MQVRRYNSYSMRRFSFFLLFIFCVATSLFAVDVDPIQQLEKRIVEHTLKNGMKVLILERTLAPLVSFEMMFRAGGVDEITGKTGLAHLFEHLMFKGSQTVGTKDYQKEKPILDEMDKVAGELIVEESKGERADLEKIKSLKKKMEELESEHQKLIIPAEFDEIYQREGGEGLNAFTSQDMTGFVVSLPSNKWELWPVLESDRMAHPVLREFYKEKDVVMEERRMRYENAPNGKLWENFIAAAFMCHPYGSPTIGWMSDIKKLVRADAENFYKTHYAPNNAVVSIVGDVHPQEVIEKLEKYFVQVTSQSLSSEIVTEEPLQSGERRLKVYFDSEPLLIMGFHKPNPPHPDNFALEMLTQILGRGRTSRFYRNIVEKKIAVSAWASNGDPGERYPNLVLFGGVARSPYGNQDLEKAIMREIEKLQNEKIPDRELQKIRNQIESEFISNLSSNGEMASQLAYCQAVLGDWHYPFRYLDRIRKVTPDDIQRVAIKYLQNRSATIAFLEREKILTKK